MMAFNLKKERDKSIWFRDITIGPLKKVEKKSQYKAKNKKLKPLKKEKVESGKKIIEKGEATKKAAHLGKTILVFVRSLFFGTLTVLAVSASAVYAYKDTFKNKAYYGTKIMGEEVGGKNLAKVQAVIDKKISEIKLSFKVDNEDIFAKPEEVGLYFKTENCARNAIELGKSGKWYEPWVSAGASLIYKTSSMVSAAGFESIISSNVPIDYRIDEAQLSIFTQNLTTKFNVESKNAGLVMNGTEVQVIPAVYGRKIVTDSIKNQIERAIKKAESPTVKIEVEKINPAIIESDTKEAMDAAKAFLNVPVIFRYQDKSYIPDKSVIGSWIVFNEQDMAGVKKLVPSVDAEKVSGYLFTIGQKIAYPAVNRKITVKNGAEQIIENEGKDGLAVDYSKASIAAAQNINAKRPVDMEIPTYVVKPKTVFNNILIADWSKYIEVNISTQTMCAYLAGGIKENCWAVTTGANGWNTPVGTFLISRKSGAGGAPGPYGGGVCMPNPPSATPLCGINWVSTFTPQGHAIHEAWWRSSFGGQDYKWNGSHGCVNTTYDIAQWIYYWAPIGTPVVIHY